MSSEAIGVTLLCTMCLVPFVAGVSLGWAARQRQHDRGELWFLPDWIVKIWRDR